MVFKKRNPVLVLTFFTIIFQACIHIRGQYLQLGKCINYPTKKNFSARNYSGTWYVIEQYLKAIDVTSVCTTHEYTTKPELTSIFGNGTFHIWSGRLTAAGVVVKKEVATLRNQSQTAKYVINPEGFPATKDEPYWILATDYRNWSLVWSCRRASIFNFQMVYFLSRTQIASRYSRDKVYSNMRKLGLNTRIMVKVPQKFC